MLFASNAKAHTITIRPETVGYGPHGHPIKGSGDKALRAKFRGPRNQFDSVATQVAKDWTDEERLEVERELISCDEFMAAPTGKGPGVRPRIYLAPEQSVPPEHQEVYRARIEHLASLGQLPAAEIADAASALPGPPVHCMAFTDTDEGLVRCSKLAALGSDLCEDDHRTQVSVA